MTFNPDPAAPENNLHHTVAYRSEEEFLDDLLGRGPGDPDMYGYPGEPKDEGETHGPVAIDAGPIDLSDVPF